jgi:hypothetical protein
LGVKGEDAMAQMTIDVETIIKQNPHVSLASLRRAEALMARMHHLGIEKTGYRLASPFSSSLRKMHKAARNEKACK